MEYNTTILIVDDEEFGRETLEDLLFTQNYNLVFAENGLQAVEKASECTPDLILLDIMMPEIDGYEACRRIRANPRISEVPIIMLTALDDNESRLQGIEAGADDFISKPYNRVELRARVKTIIRLNRYRRILAGRTKFEWVVDQAEDGYLVLDENLCINYINAQARTYLGLPNDDSALDASFVELATKQYHCEPEQAWESWPEAASNGSEQPAQYLIRPESDNSQPFWLEVNTLTLPSETEGRWTIHLRDVTTKMEMKRNMWAFQALVSHKLRTPLASVFTGLTLLEEDGITNAFKDDRTARIFELVFSGAKRLQRDVEDILEFLHTPYLAQSEAGCDLSQIEPVIDQICTDLELEEVSLNHIEIKHGQLALSEETITLILKEILENSKKFHPQQMPIIQVETYPIQNNQIKLIIKDNGTTLAPDQITQAWIPFYQGDKHFAGEVKGMGLGLSSVATLVWGVGGQCHLRNRDDGPGVVVELVLPFMGGNDP